MSIAQKTTSVAVEVPCCFLFGLLLFSWGSENFCLHEYKNVQTPYFLSSPLRLNQPYQDSQILQLLYGSITVDSLLSGFLGAIPVLIVPMVSAFRA